MAEDQGFIIGEFYGHNFSTTNLEMIARFFEKYPEYAEKTFLSVKVSVAYKILPTAV